MRLVLFFFASAFVFASCSKDPETKVYPPAGGTWTFNIAQSMAAFSEITDRKGFQLTFSDKSTANQLSFLLRSRPGTATTFIAAADTSMGSNIAVHLESGGRGYHAVNGVNVDVTVEIESGKLHLRGKGIRIMPDTGSDPEALLDFDLKEY